jgi:hypothetical protein
MTIQYPNALDDLSASNPGATDLVDGSAGPPKPHHTQHSDANGAIDALEKLVGILNSTDATSLVYALNNLVALLSGANNFTNTQNINVTTTYNGAPYLEVDGLDIKVTGTGSTGADMYGQNIEVDVTGSGLSFIEDITGFNVNVKFGNGAPYGGPTDYPAYIGDVAAAFIDAWSWADHISGLSALGFQIRQGRGLADIGYLSYGAIDVYAGTITNAYGYYLTVPNLGGGGTCTNIFGVWIDDLSNVSPTNMYGFWMDSPGVFRIKGDGVIGYYNPSYSPKYTPGATSFERVVLQWDAVHNVIQLITEAGSTGGTLRNIQVGAPGTTTGIGTTPNQPCAVLQSDSTAQGWLMPRMTTTQKNAISSPVAGLMVYDTVLGAVCVYNGSAWKTVTMT